jgi:5-methylcytosine-specific restriction endonuclease McrA
MKSEFRDLLTEVKKIRLEFKQLNHRVNILYDTQWAEKVTNGYEIWRFDSKGGLLLVRKQLIKLDYKCPVCYAPLTETSATVDHLRPKSKYLGLVIDEKNMLVMCHSCNAAKNNKEFEEWYSNLPLEWRKRLDKAIKEIHGTIKLVELVPTKIK